ncbi:MAG TPA: flagellar biosynthesis anti-sigma factor FlgM [Novosphingobium sp.]|nr:flagellar biosynthesis anti-sigma factor FlgM [Novosphingobium sp.]
MPPIETGPARALSAIGARIARKAGGDTLPGANGVAAAGRTMVSDQTGAAGAAVATSEALDPGAAPVDAARVEEIRKAVKSGSYPLIPTKIADAMIAAGVLLRSGK